MTRRFGFACAAVCFLAGWIAAQFPMTRAWGWQSSVKDPQHVAAMNVQVRMAQERDFTDSTMKYNIEVYRDENNGNLIYICETGSISVVPGKL